MSKDYKQEYEELIKTRKYLDYNIIKDKKRNSWNYFRSLDICLKNLEKNMTNNIFLYSAPLKEIHGTNMANWPIINGSEIYLDTCFLLDNANIEIINCQLTHEVLHSLSRKIGGGKNWFNHNEDIYEGIDEFTTQFFTEEIEKTELNEKEDYLYFGKNIMRNLSDIIGIDKLSSQYLNNDRNFEVTFNSLSTVSFLEFANCMNTIYELSKKEKYFNITKEEKEFLEQQKVGISEFVSLLYNNNKAITK